MADEATNMGPENDQEPSSENQKCDCEKETKKRDGRRKSRRPSKRRPRRRR